MQTALKNLRLSFLSTALAAIFALGAGGCGEGAQPVDKKVDQVQSEMLNMGKAAKAAGGDFNKLSQADKEKFLARVQGNEAAAAQMVQQMAGAGGPRGAGSK